jgi:hypothetical protein
MPHRRESSVIVDLTAFPTFFHTEAGYGDEPTVLRPHQWIPTRVTEHAPEELNGPDSSTDRRRCGGLSEWCDLTIRTGAVWYRNIGRYRESLCGFAYWRWSMNATKSLRSAPEASGAAASRSVGECVRFTQNVR